MTSDTTTSANNPCDLTAVRTYGPDAKSPMGGITKDEFVH